MMKTITLYRYTRPSGGVTVTPAKPDVPYTTAFRLVADEGMMLKSGDIIAPSIDTDHPEEWREIPDPDYEDGLTVADCLGEMERLGVNV